MRAALLGLLLLAPAAGEASLWRRERVDAVRALFEKGSYEKVIAELRPERLQRLRAREQKLAYFYLGVSHERLGQLDKALGLYQLGVRLYPRDIDLLTQLAQLLHRMGLEEQAEPLFQRVLNIHPNNAASHHGLAEIDRALGFYDRSAEHYEKALGQWDDHAPIWRDYAEVLLLLGELPTAALAVRRSLQLQREPEAFVVLAQIERASGRIGAALEALAEAAELSPQRRELKLARALWLLESENGEAAGALAAEALREDPAEPLALWIRANLHLSAGRRAAAVSDLQAAAQAGRTAPFIARSAAALLESLRGAAAR